jgi:hypothetical protein
MGSRKINRDSFSSFNDLLPDCHFGSESADIAIKIMPICQDEGKLVFGDCEIDAVSCIEGAHVNWIDIDGRHRESSWWYESVRIPRNRGISEGDELIVSLFPWSGLQVSVSRFQSIAAMEPHSFSGNRFLLDSSEVFFQNESELITSFFADDLRFFGDSDSLIAVVRQPILFHGLFQVGDRQPRAKDRPRLVYGVVRRPENVESVSMALFEDSAVLEMRHLASKGKLSFAFPSAPSGLTLSYEVRDLVEGLLLILVRMVLAGPSDKSEKWFGKPVSLLLGQVFRAVLNNLNRQEVSRKKKEGSGSRHMVSRKGKSRDHGDGDDAVDFSFGVNLIPEGGPDDLGFIDSCLSRIKNEIDELSSWVDSKE